ncbi:MAG TPA: hypothetical protein VFC54_14545 [Pseudolabrys sp.]|nr:hypothetical protein [Pseudolabrys sp.]
MTPAREFGQRRVHPHEPNKAAPASGAGKVRLALYGLAFAAMVAAGWMTLADSSVVTSLMSRLGLAGNGLDFSGTRIGRSATAPVLKLCLTKQTMGIRADADLSPDMLLIDLKASIHGRITRSLDAPREHWVIELAQMWGEVADCVYHQNAFRLCDIDNRTLAVESGSIFVGQADKIIAQPSTTYGAAPGNIHGLQATRDRVLDLMRNRVQNGVLIAGDFPFGFAPEAVRAMLNGTETLRNECAAHPEMKSN